MKYDEVSKLLPALCFGELPQEQVDEIHVFLAENEDLMEEYIALSMALEKSKMPSLSM